MGLFDWFKRKPSAGGQAGDATVQKPSRSADPQDIYNAALQLFDQDKFKEAAAELERAAQLAPNSASIQFTLGAAYSRISGQFGKDESAMRPWAKKSVEAFWKSLVLSGQHGGLDENQFEKACDAVIALDSVFAKQPASSADEKMRAKVRAIVIPNVRGQRKSIELARKATGATEARKALLAIADIMSEDQNLSENLRGCAREGADEEAIGLCKKIVESFTKQANSLLPGADERMNRNK